MSNPRGHIPPTPSWRTVKVNAKEAKRQLHHAKCERRCFNPNKHTLWPPAGVWWFGIDGWNRDSSTFSCVQQRELALFCSGPAHPPTHQEVSTGEGPSRDQVGLTHVKQVICSRTVSGVCVCVLSCQVRWQASRCASARQ